MCDICSDVPGKPSLYEGTINPGSDAKVSENLQLVTHIRGEKLRATENLHQFKGSAGTKPIVQVNLNHETRGS
jgi:hypothetical protein